MTTTYRQEYRPSTQEILDTFTDEVTALGGRVLRVVDDHDRLIARSVLTIGDEIRPGDRVNGGIAIRAAGPEIMVHPYTYRQVCTNGAIAVQSVGTHRVERVPITDVFTPTYEVAVALRELRDAVCACAEPEVFTSVADGMRTAAEVDADMAIQLLPHLAQLPPTYRQSVMSHVFHRFAEENDRSAFALFNAVTSVARDTEDPELRWTLETIGGSLLARLRPPRVPQPTATTHA